MLKSNKLGISWNHFLKKMPRIRLCILYFCITSNRFWNISANMFCMFQSGMPSQAFEYIHYNNGLMNESTYPFTGKVMYKMQTWLCKILMLVRTYLYLCEISLLANRQNVKFVFKHSVEMPKNCICIQSVPLLNERVENVWFSFFNGALDVLLKHCISSQISFVVILLLSILRFAHTMTTRLTPVFR